MCAVYLLRVVDGRARVLISCAPLANRSLVLCRVLTHGGVYWTKSHGQMPQQVDEIDNLQEWSELFPLAGIVQTGGLVGTDFFSPHRLLTISVIADIETPFFVSITRRKRFSFKRRLTNMSNRVKFHCWLPSAPLAALLILLALLLASISQPTTDPTITLYGPKMLKVSPVWPIDHQGAAALKWRARLGDYHTSASFVTTAL